MDLARTQTFDIDMGTYSISVTRKRVKNVNFRIGADGKAHMSIPPHVTDAQAQRLALERSDWFAKALERTRNQSAQTPRAWQTGEELRVWGTPRRLLVVSNDEQELPCVLVEDTLRVWRGTDARQRSHYVERWLRDQLADRIDTLLPRCEAAVGCHATHISIRRMKTRWGSCTPSTGRIRMNTALAECPPACTETVLVHELCHLRVRNHGPRFKALMDLHNPGWRVTQRWLDAHPPSPRD